MISAKLVGGPEAAAKFKTAKPRIQAKLEETMLRWAIRLMRHVKEDKLSGQVLKNRTGRLRRSINYRVEGTGTSNMVTTVGTNVVYARPHEYGETVTVKAHLRMMTKAWGRPVRNPRQIMVKEHTVKYPERSFLRSALQDLEAQIREDLSKSIKVTFSEGL